MSKKIKHIQVMNIFKSFDEHTHYQTGFRLEVADVMLIKNYVEEQNKDSKLLELYRQLSVIRNDLLSYCEVVDDDYDDFEYIEIDLEKRIRELEDEFI